MRTSLRGSRKLLRLAISKAYFFKFISQTLKSAVVLRTAALFDALQNERIVYIFLTKQIPGEYNKTIFVLQQ